MSDLISRQTAIDEVKHYIEIGYDSDIIHTLENLPSAQPELPSCGYCPFAKCIIGDRPCSMKGVERVERLNQQTDGDRSNQPDMSDRYRV